MTLADITARLAEIRSAAQDDEIAHSLEDDLRAEVLQAIADGAADAPLLAAEVLKTSAIDFARWCA